MPKLSYSQKISALINAWHGFMRPDIRSDGAILLVGTMNGTEVIGCDNIIGSDPPPSDCPEDEAHNWTVKVAEYCSAGIVDPDSCFETVEGFIVRMSAPGYLDATDWTYCETEEDVLRWLEHEAEDIGGFDIPYPDKRDIDARREFIRINSHVLQPVIFRAWQTDSMSQYGAWEHRERTSGPAPYDHVMVQYATGSDYSGDTVHRANFQDLSEMDSEYPGDIIPVHGGHGTYGIVIRLDCAPGLWDIITGLADYPCINDESVSEIETEWRDDALPEFKSDTLRAILAKFPDGGDTLGEAMEDRIRKIADEICEAWEDWTYQHSDAYADPDKAAMRTMKHKDMEAIIDDAYCDAIPTVPEDSAAIRYVVEDASGTIVETSYAGPMEHNDIISWVYFAYSPAHHVRIYSAPVHPLDTVGG